MARVTVDDGDGAGSAASTGDIVIGNIAPQLANVTITPVVPESGEATLTGDIIDLAIEPFTLVVNWGDATVTEAGVVTESPVGPPGSSAGLDGTVSGSHVYADIRSRAFQIPWRMCS